MGYSIRYRVSAVKPHTLHRATIMKRLIPAALAIALLAPLATARADSNTYNFCTTGLSLNFCGSVEVTATAASGGGTDVSFTVRNTSSGNPLAVFTAIGINNAGIGGGATYSNLQVTQGGNTYTGWQIGVGTVGDGSGGTLTVNALSSTVGSALDNSISSQCSGPFQRIYTCNGAAAATISFHTTDNFSVLANGMNATSVYVNAAAENGACVAGCSTTTTPEPATLALFATGLLGLGGPVSRWRRRRDS
jgi:MYXO-CTERM domain-containing protein